MKGVSVDEFCNLKFLSQPKYSPQGTNFCFVVSTADKKGNKYDRFIYTMRNGKPVRLTGGGKEGSFTWIDENSLIFRGDREEKKDGSLKSIWYRIRVDGGEAEKFLEFPVPVSAVLPLANGDFVVTASVIPGWEDLYKGDAKRMAAYLKYKKENEDFEEVMQVPFWNNGGSFTKGGYNSLYYYNKRSGKLRPLSESKMRIAGAKLSNDKKSVFFFEDDDKPLLSIEAARRLCRVDLQTGEKTVVAETKTGFAIQNFELMDSFILVMAHDGRMGLNTDCDFFRVEYDSFECSLLSKWGEALYSSVGSDISLGGGGISKAVGDTYYFITTLFDSSYICKLEDGVISKVTQKEGSVDCFDICGKQIAAICKYDMRAQELYDGKGKRLTSFNSRALSGKYVAKPEILNIETDGHCVHGFVLKPFGYEKGKKYPVIFDIHGGPKTVYGPVFYHEMQYWAGLGYFVVFCNPTGSDGRNSFMDIRGKYGTVDFADLMAFLDSALAAYPDMDTENLFETGGSYGGFMTNWIIGHTDRFRACASQRSISNWFSFYGVSDIGVEFATDQNASDPWGNAEKLWEHSPMKYANHVKTPTLFIHSFEDYRCPIDQGYQMYTSLVARGVEAKMVLFYGENHELSRSGKPLHRLKRLNEITSWFENHRKK